MFWINHPRGGEICLRQGDTCLEYVRAVVGFSSENSNICEELLFILYDVESAGHNNCLFPKHILGPDFIFQMIIETLFALFLCQYLATASQHPARQISILLINSRLRSPYVGLISVDYAVGRREDNELRVSVEQIGADTRLNTVFVALVINLVLKTNEFVALVIWGVVAQV